jgi:hypothetical protein
VSAAAFARVSGRVFATLALTSSIFAVHDSAAQGIEPLLDRSNDQILERRPITSRGRRHGEVRVIGRGDAVVIQTLLSSKVLKRVVAGIRDRELESWPPEQEGHAAALSYLAALDAATKAAQARSPKPHEKASTGTTNTRDRRRSLLIEFILSKTRHGVVIAHPELLDEPSGELTLTGVRDERALDVPRPFVERDMKLIAKDRGLSLPQLEHE